MALMNTSRTMLAAVSLFLISCLESVAHPETVMAVPVDGVVSGFVAYGGGPASPAPVPITKDREVCGTAPLFDQSLVVGSDRGLANVVVTLSNTEKAPPLNPLPAIRFDQKGCQYIPHVLVFPAGSTVVILNSDGILHNIHTESVVNPAIDMAQPGFKKQIRVTIQKPEVIKVTCDAHNWMVGWWYVTGTPYYAVTGSDGRYVIRGVPPGTYTLHFWQEQLGTHSQQVVTRPGTVTVANFTFKLRENRGS
jgi:plastocyanin